MFEINIDTSGVRQFLVSLLSLTRKSAQEVLEDAGGDIVTEMRTPGDPVTYPIQWDSEKQRKKVMGMLRATNNLPYKRTGAYVNGWTLTSLPNGIAVTNKSPAGAIGGTLTAQSSGSALAGAGFSSWQSRIHRGRWKEVRTVVLQAIADIPRRVVEKIKAMTQ